MIVRRTTIAELESAPNFQLLLEEYGTESSIEGLPTPRAKIDLYKQIEGGGQLQPLGAWASAQQGGELIGMAAVINTVMPHYGIIVSVMESIFVTAERRNTGAGLGLIRLGEKVAVAAGSPGLMISAVAGSALEMVMPRVGYQNTNTAWFKALGKSRADSVKVGGVDDEVLSGTAVLLTEVSPVEGVC